MLFSNFYFSSVRFGCWIRGQPKAKLAAAAAVSAVSLRPLERDGVFIHTDERAGVSRLRARLPPPPVPRPSPVRSFVRSFQGAADRVGKVRDKTEGQAGEARNPRPQVRDGPQDHAGAVQAGR